MNAVNTTSRLLGVAFLFQFVTSFSSGVFLKQTWFVPGNMGATMLKIADNSALMRTYILLDMFTALGVIFLGVMLYLTLRNQSEPIALTALTCYVLEGALLAASRTEAFALVRFSQEYAAGQSAVLLTMGQVAYESMEFVGVTLHMLAFCLGAILFYSLLYTSGVVPRPLVLWGLIAIIPLLIGTVTHIVGYTLPFVLYLPYVPFELVIAIWILVTGMPAEMPSLGNNPGSAPYRT
jgi:hypothetical protein